MVIIMRLFIFFLLITLAIQEDTLADINYDKLIWLSGSDQANYGGEYIGYKNDIKPISRSYHAAWRVSKYIVIFGGKTHGSDNYLNDLIISSDGQRFIWLSGSDGLNSAGSYSSYNGYGIPRARSAMVTFNLLDNIYIFSGIARNIFCDDLFSISKSAITNHYHTSVNHFFRWVGGSDSSNSGIYNYGEISWPRSRYGAVSWNSNDNKYGYLYSGHTSTNINSNYMNDLFLFNQTHFIWIGGCDQLDPVSFYPSNYDDKGIPGGRRYALAFSLNSAVYLFGGDNGFSLNDLWKSNDNGRNWYWLAGSSVYNPNYFGEYNGIGSKGFPMPRDSISFFIYENYVIIHGGYSSAKIGYLNDFWAFSENNNSFILLIGDNISNTLPFYNDYWEHAVIGSRSGDSMILMEDSVYFLFGFGMDVTALKGYMNDCFKIVLPFNSSSVSSFVFTIFHATMIGTISSLTFFLFIFLVLNTSILSSFSFLYTSKYLVLVLINILLTIAEIYLLLLLLFYSKWIYFSLSLFFFVLSLIHNANRIIRWSSLFLKCSNRDELQQFLTNSKFFYFIANIAIFLSPAFLFVLKSNLNNSLRLPINEMSVSIPILCLLHDIYFLLPQSVILYFYLFPNIRKWNIGEWIIVIIFFSNQLVAIFRGFLTVVRGGGAMSVASKPLKFGLQRTIKQKAIPSLVSSSYSDISVELSSDEISASSKE